MTSDPGLEAAESTETKLSAEDKSKNTLVSAAIVLLAGLVYLPSVNGSLIWDDSEILSGRGIGNSGSILQCFLRPFLYHYYRPLTSVTFLLDHRMWGGNSIGYHVTNLLLHVLTTVILLALLSVAFADRRIALIGAFLFAVQPAQVSAVAWIGGRTDSLCTLAISAFFLALISGAKSEGARRRNLLAASLACYALAVLAKEQAMFLLPLMSLGVKVFRPIGTKNRELLRDQAVWTTLLLTVALALLLMWRRFGQPVRLHWDVIHQLSMIGLTIDYYALLLIAPTPQLLHTLTLVSIGKLGGLGVLIGYILAAGAVAIFLRWMRTEPVVAWFFAGTVLLLLPVTNLFPLSTQIVAPYRAATAGLGAAVVVGWSLIRCMDRVKGSSLRQSLLIVAPVAVYCAWLCSLAFWDDAAWKNSLLASAAVERYDPTCKFGILETASSYLDIGKVDEAIKRIDTLADMTRSNRSDEVTSDSRLAWTANGYAIDWMADLYGRAGQLKLDAGDSPGAIAVLHKGYLLNPRNAIINSALANYLLSVHDYVGAEQPIRNVLDQQPGLTGLRAHLGQLLVNQHRWKDADTEFTICLKQQPLKQELFILTAYVRMKSNNRSGAANVLADGLKRGVLDRNKLDEWLKSIGQTGIL